MKTCLRCITAPWYLLGWISHVYLGLTHPQFYRSLGDFALIPAFRVFWHNFIMPDITFFALLLAGFEIVVGLLLIGKGRWVKTGVFLSILFNLFLIQMGFGVPAADAMGDFVANRMPNVIFLLIQIPMLFGNYDRTLPEILFRKLKVTQTGAGNNF